MVTPSAYMWHQMDYTLATSLERTTLIEIAATLWNVSDVETFASRFYCPLISSSRMDEWQKIEYTVVKKVSKLPLPIKLKHKVLYFIRPVGLQILRWIDFHYYSFRFVTKLPSKFFWTSQGTIDKERTAELLVNDESLSTYTRYKMACIYCLEDHIHILWKQLLKDPYKIDLEYVRIHETPLVSFWSHYLEGEIAQLDDIMKDYCGDVTPYEYAFCRFAKSGDEAAARYFLKKLTPEEKAKTLVITADNVAHSRCTFDYDRTDFPKEYYTDVLRFLLLQLDEEQQTQVFKRYSSWLLKCFFDWPRQCFIMIFAERAWNFLSEEDYYHLLYYITDYTFIENISFNYREHFTEFWQQSPSTRKTYVMNQYISKCLELNMFSTGDMKLVFKYAAAGEREKNIFYTHERSIFPAFNFGKFGLLKFFAHEFTTSKYRIIRFKEELKTFTVQRLSENQLEKENYMFNIFYQLLDDVIETYDEKRNVEESDYSAHEIFCV